jgi:HSP20 family protein
MMTTLSVKRIDPFAEMVSLRQAMDRLFADSFVRTSNGFPTAGGHVNSLAVDVRETDEAYVVEATVPGVKPDAVEVTIHGDLLTIKVEANQEAEQENGNYLVRERRYGRSSRSLRIPEAIVADKAEASFENGILTLNIPKAEEVKPKVIQVKSK